jgi:hypothetical protein
MYIGKVAINVDYPEELLSRNLCLTVFIVQRWDKKVIKASIVERRALPNWYAENLKQFSPGGHYFMVSTTSLIGEIIDIQMGEQEDKEKQHNTDTRLN